MAPDTWIVNGDTGESVYVDDGSDDVVKVSGDEFAWAYMFEYDYSNNKESVDSNGTYQDVYQNYLNKGEKASTYQLDFVGKVVTDNEVTGRELSNSKHADYGILGKMQVNAVFDDGSTFTTNEYYISSGPYYNGPTPNKNYTGSKFVRTNESGMKINGQTGWKVYLENHNGRSGLRIHPDTNNRGTAGCIGVLGATSELKGLGNFLNNYINTQGKSIKVNFQIPNNPNYGNEGRAVKSPGQ